MAEVKLTGIAVGRGVATPTFSPPGSDIGRPGRGSQPMFECLQPLSGGARTDLGAGTLPRRALTGAVVPIPDRGAPNFSAHTTDQGEQVKPSAHTAKPASTSKAGRFAALGGVRHAPGTGVPARSSAVAGVASLCALAAGLLFAAPAFALNPERHYEMVSPVYKGGYGVEAFGNFPGIMAIAPDGDRVVFSSKGAFAGTPSEPPFQRYLATRGASGWSTAPLTPPATIAPWTLTGDPLDYSPTLETTLSNVKLGVNNGSAFWRSGEMEFLLHRTDAPDTAPNAPQPGPNFEVAGETLKTVNGEPLTAFGYQGADPGFCHTVVAAGSGEPLLADAVGLTWAEVYYDLASGCGEAPSLRLVDANNQGHPIDTKCEPHFVEGSPIAAGGKELFFYACAPGAASRAPQVFVRLGGQRTLEVSRPRNTSEKFGGCIGEEAPHVAGEVPCAGASVRPEAEFDGASIDGSKVFFATTAWLGTGDTDAKNHLYEATIGCLPGEPGCEVAKREVTSLTQVSHDPNAGEDADVQGVITVSPDGSRVFFVARGELLTAAAREALESEGHEAPHKGADNLYVYDAATQTMSFIADLCSGPLVSGEVEDVRCPADLEPEGNGSRNDSALFGHVEKNPEAQLSDTAGRFLVFSTYARLASDDTNNAKDVYRYDAVTGTLERTSVGEAGHDANGNGAGDATITSDGFSESYVRTQYGGGTRAISEDGSRIVFTTARPLSPGAVNGLANVYEWHEGATSLISSGQAVTPVTEVLITPSGDDIFFATTEGLVPQDTDSVRDVYDARLPHVPGEQVAFPLPAAERRPCEGDACQGPLTNPAPLLVPDSVSQAPGENLPPPPKATVKKLTRAQQLASALEACAKKPKSKRVACRRGARKRGARKKYAKAAKSAGRSGR